MRMRRVVVTGVGAVTPLGVGVENVWRRLLNGESGANTISAFSTEGIDTHYAANVPRGALADGLFNPDDWLDSKTQRRLDDFIIFGIAAAQMAMTDSGWEPKTDDEKCRTGTVVGSGIGGLPGIEEAAITLKEKGPRRISPFFIPGRIINLVSGEISIRFGAKGPSHSVVTACSTGAHAIGDAARMIMLDDADVMIAGGAEAAICPLGMAGFAACRALSKAFNDAPHRASRPYDKDRDGFVMGEGAGIVVLEELEHARRRGAKIYGEIVGYGLSGDAYHITAPAPDGNGGFRAMQMALKRAGMTPADIDYVNAHGTSTPLGDEIELKAVERLFGNAAANVSMSSTKSSVGHLLGAAGAVEAIFSLLALRDQIAPATINLENPSVESPIDLVPLQPRKRTIRAALSNSFGFGGTNATLIMTPPPA